MYVQILGLGFMSFVSGLGGRVGREPAVLAGWGVWESDFIPGVTVRLGIIEREA